MNLSLVRLEVMLLRRSPVALAMVALVASTASDCAAGAAPGVTPAAVAATVTDPWTVMVLPAASRTLRSTTTVCPLTRLATVVVPGVPTVLKTAVVDAAWLSYTAPAAP